MAMISSVYSSPSSVPCSMDCWKPTARFSTCIPRRPLTSSTPISGMNTGSTIRFIRLRLAKRTRSIAQKSCQRLCGRSSFWKSPFPLLP